MPPECEQLRQQPSALKECPKCGRASPDFMRGQVQRSRRFLGFLWQRPYCAVICQKCFEIIGWEMPTPGAVPRNTSEQDLIVAWLEMEAALAVHAQDLDLSFGVEYSSAVDWQADFTPRKGHSKARNYGNVWSGTGSTAAVAIQRALQHMQRDLTLGGTTENVGKAPP